MKIVAGGPVAAALVPSQTVAHNTTTRTLSTVVGPRAYCETSPLKHYVLEPDHRELWQSIQLDLFQVKSGLLVGEPHTEFSDDPEYERKHYNRVFTSRSEVKYGNQWSAFPVLNLPNWWHKTLLDVDATDVRNCGEVRELHKAYLLKSALIDIDQQLLIGLTTGKMPEHFIKNPFSVTVSELCRRVYWIEPQNQEVRL